MPAEAHHGKTCLKCGIQLQTDDAYCTGCRSESSNSKVVAQFPKSKLFAEETPTHKSEELQPQDEILRALENEIEKIDPTLKNYLYQKDDQAQSAQTATRDSHPKSKIRHIAISLAIAAVALMGIQQGPGIRGFIHNLFSNTHPLTVKQNEQLYQIVLAASVSGPQQKLTVRNDVALAYNNLPKTLPVAQRSVLTELRSYMNTYEKKLEDYEELGAGDLRTFQGKDDVGDRLKCVDDAKACIASATKLYNLVGNSNNAKELLKVKDQLMTGRQARLQFCLKYWGKYTVNKDGTLKCSAPKSELDGFEKTIEMAKALPAKEEQLTNATKAEIASKLRDL